MGKKTTDGGIWPLIENLCITNIFKDILDERTLRTMMKSYDDDIDQGANDRVIIGGMMRQPKYMMGEEVIVTLEMTHNPSGLSRAFDAPGIVTSIGYDPKDKTTGAPFYRYGILLDDSSKGIHVNEYDIKEK